MMRINKYSTVANKLASMSDKQLTELLKTVTSFDSSMGGETTTLVIENTPVFVKKIALTDLEQQPENIRSTANLFKLPMYYQYGIGSIGFGAWRELAVHVMTSNWVLDGECEHFPLMYHWRVLPEAMPEISQECLAEIDSIVEEWGGSPAIYDRLLAQKKSSSSIVLFLEFIPENLDDWLKKQNLEDEQVAESACHMVEKNLKVITSFIRSKNLLHFDAHFLNIMMDGYQLYLSDFGLAISSSFTLSETELEFFEQHQNYDQCYTMAYFVEWLLIRLFKKDEYETLLVEYANGKIKKELSTAVTDILIRYAPMTVVIDAFHQEMRKNKNTPYPKDKLESFNRGKKHEK